MKRLFLIGLLTILVFTLNACGGGDEAAAPDNGQSAATYSGDPVHGEELYEGTCIACHGPGGSGVENLGKPFTTSDFIRGKTELNLLAFIKQGRPTGDPDNTTGVDMPPKGGNPALSDDDILDIIAYIRTIQE
jgi:disulfide bond formation protein DsbB